MIDAFKDARINPEDVWAQSFDQRDILYWIQNEPQFGKQAVYLVETDPSANPPLLRKTIDELRALKARGVKIVAPPIPDLLAVNANNEIVPSQYALDIKAVGFASSPGLSSAPICVRALRKAASITPSIPKAAPSRKTAICTRRWMCWPNRSA